MLHVQPETQTQSLQNLTPRLTPRRHLRFKLATEVNIDIPSSSLVPASECPRLDLSEA